MELYADFVELAQKSGERVALLGGQRSLSYQQLDRLSSALADNMAQSGFQPGQRAAIYLDKEIEAIVCMLATLKAGGIYIPIAYRQPAKRVNYICANCEISALFMRQEQRPALGKELLPPESLENIVWVENDASGSPVFQMQPAAFHQRALPNSEKLAFLLYTSGSTGVPKGVKISCQNAAVFIDWCRHEMNIGASDILLNLAGFHFDLSVFDIFVALSVGAKLIVMPEHLVINPFEICKTIEEKQVTVIYCVPSLLTMLLASGAAEKYRLTSLRYVLFAGETFPIKYLKALRALLPQAMLYNLYGPTETNVCSYYQVSEIEPDRTEPVPIGTAVSGATLYAKNDRGEPLADGEVGELYVSGPCVTPGYWNYQDSRNAENHRHNIHATGDLVSWKNGNFVFHGRKDNQIKLKGYRIELDEIESVLGNHEQVKECAVIVVKIADNLKLIACIGTKNGNLLAAELREYCQKQLPHYMVPQFFHIVEQLPKNSNGKIDRLKLKENFY